MIGPGRRTPVAPLNEVIVNGLAGLPTPIAGVITLAPDTHYIIAVDISGPDRVALSANNVITMNSVFSPLWEYTGVGSMFTGVDVNVQMPDVRLNCPNGQVFDLSSPTAVGGNTALLRAIIVENCAKFGTFNNLNTVDMTDASGLNADDGITVLGNTNWSIFSFSKFALISTSASFIGFDFGVSLHRTVEALNLVLRAPASAIGIKGAAGSANLVTGALATVVGGEFSGGLTPLSGIAIEDIRWDFQANAGIPDSISDALLSFSGNVLETAIAFVNTPVKTNAVWTCVRESRFICATDGRATFNAEREDFFPVDVSAGIISVGGTPITATVHLAKGGTAIPGTGVPVAISGTIAKVITIPWQVDLAKDEYLEVFVENNTNDNNIIVQNATLRVR